MAHGRKLLKEKRGAVAAHGDTIPGHFLETEGDAQPAYTSMIISITRKRSSFTTNTG